MVADVLITMLCAVGLYASLFMLAKHRRAARGELRGPSVVKSPRARLFGPPNSLFGAAYYPALAIVTWATRWRSLELAALAAVLFAACTSVVLAYSLLYVTRRACPYCWTAHAVNWLLLILFPYHIWG